MISDSRLDIEGEDLDTRKGKLRGMTVPLKQYLQESIEREEMEVLKGYLKTCTPSNEDEILSADYLSTLNLFLRKLLLYECQNMGDYSDLLDDINYIITAHSEIHACMIQVRMGKSIRLGKVVEKKINIFRRINNVKKEIPQSYLMVSVLDTITFRVKAMNNYVHEKNEPRWENVKRISSLDIYFQMNILEFWKLRHMREPRMNTRRNYV